jgi:hypothetical protein
MIFKVKKPLHAPLSVGRTSPPVRNGDDSGGGPSIDLTYPMLILIGICIGLML